jgi:hypothetical protein
MEEEENDEPQLSGMDGLSQAQGDGLIAAVVGALTGVYLPGELDALRDEWE